MRYIFIKHLTGVYNMCIIKSRGETMKRKDLIKLFEKNGWRVLREGGNHTIYTNGKASEPISRQTEINEL
jgi:hypothetical protein